MVSRRIFVTGLATIAATAAVGAGMLMAQGNRSTPAFNTLDSPSGAAIKGYDPVAYFVSGRPEKGSEAHAVTHGGVRWLFASAENKQRFEKDPAAYLPAYGGYCAYGVAAGYLVKIEPDAWAIRDGKLYLNYDSSVQAKWQRDPAGQIKAADAKWPKLISTR